MIDPEGLPRPSRSAIVGNTGTSASAQSNSPGHGVLAATLLGLPDPLVQAREAGIFRSYEINGIPVGSILLIPALTTALQLVIVVAIITIVGGAVFGEASPESWTGNLRGFS